MFRYIVFLILLFCQELLAIEFPDPQIVWEYTCGEPLVGTPVFYPSVSEPSGIIILTSNGKMILVDQQGKEVWLHDFKEPVQATPAVGDVDGDGLAEIVTASVGGEVLILSESGQEKGRYRLAGRVIDWMSPCLADLDGDGINEILIGDEAGWMNALSGIGQRIWRIKADAHTTSTPAVVPDSMGKVKTIIYGNENDHIVAVDPGGGLCWITREEGQYGRNNPTVGDLDGDGDYEVIVHTSFNNPNSRLLALDTGNGQLLWQAKLNLHGYVSNTIVDLEGDGRNEVVVAMRSNTIYCFDGNGRERWHTITGGNAFFWTPAVADINGDGRCEIIAGVRRTNERGNSWFVLDDQGHILGEYEMPGGANAAPLVADINEDDQLDIILPGSDKGLLRCVTFGGKKRGARMEWVSHRYDARRSGYKPAVIKHQKTEKTKKSPLALSVKWIEPLRWGENALRFEPPMTPVKRLVLEVSKTAPSGQREVRVYDRDRSDSSCEITLDLAGAGAHQLSIRLWDPSDWSTPAALYQETISLKSIDDYIEKLQTKLTERVNQGQVFAGADGTVARLLAETSALRRGSLQQLADRFAGADFSRVDVAQSFMEASRAFNNLLEQDAARIKIAGQVVNAGRHTMAVWEDRNPWDEKDPLLDSAVISGNLVLDVPMYINESESRVLTILNLRPQSIDVQIRRMKGTDRDLQLYEVIKVPRKEGRPVSDALAALNSAQSIHLAAGEARQIWLTIKAENLSAGKDDLSLDLLPLGLQEDRITVSIRRKMIPLDLRQAPLFYACNWSSPKMLEETGIDPLKISNARSHGINVFVLGLPACQADAEGELSVPPDWTLFDRYLALLDEDCFLLIPGGEIRIPDSIERFGATHVKAQQKWFTEIRNHLHKKGWGIDRWALYPVDEPGLFGGTLIKRFVEIAGHFKRAMADVPVYANPAGFVTIENMREMVPLVDVWSPEQALMRRQPELAPFFLETGKPVWSYEAPPAVKTLLPLGYYRANAWMAFQLGLSGTGFWTQFYGDLWLKETVVDYGANYIAGGNEIISRRWEAYRDGLEDVRAFRLLQQAVEAAKAAGRNQDQIEESGKLLTSDIADMTKVAWSSNDITRFLRDYEMDFDGVQAIRQRVMELTLQLMAKDD